MHAIFEQAYSNVLPTPHLKLLANIVFCKQQQDLCTQSRTDKQLMIMSGAVFTVCKLSPAAT